MTKIFCDTANIAIIKNCINKYKVDGVTTNPSIMRSDGVKITKTLLKHIKSLKR